MSKQKLQSNLNKACKEWTRLEKLTLSRELTKDEQTSKYVNGEIIIACSKELQERKGQ